MPSTPSNPEQPARRRVVFVDVEEPLPSLTADDRYSAAMVVVRRDRVPQAALDIDLRQPADSTLSQLEALVHSIQTRVPSDVRDLPDPELPRISVVVPTIVAREHDLEILLDGFSRVQYPHVEYLLVDNRSRIPDPDVLPRLLEGREAIRVIHEPRPGISAARNAGVAAATGDVIVFTDDDVRVDPLWLTAIGRRFARDSSVDAVTGLILPAELETAAQIWFERYYGGFGGERSFRPLILKGESEGFTRPFGSRITVRDDAGSVVRKFPVYGVGAYGAGANMAFRRSTLEQIGGFDVALGTGTVARGGEDLAALIAILWSGGTVVYEPAAVVHHRHRREYAELLKQLGGNGSGFTAMLTALVIHDRRHLLGLASQLPIAAGQMLKKSVARLRGPGAAAASPSAESDSSMYPRELVITEMRGYPKGPMTYLRSQKAARTWTPRTQ